ncbi:hypothetical protein [Methylobacterium radiotolerans]
MHRRPKYQRSHGVHRSDRRQQQAAAECRDAIEQVSPGPDGQSSIYLNGGEQRTMIQAQQSVELIRKALLTARKQTVVASAH